MERKPISTRRLKFCPFENPFGYVYIYTNKINGHKYIGKHTFKKPYIDLTYKGSGSKHWHDALKKYGWENFEKEVLFLLEDLSILTTAEKEQILLDEERQYIYYLGLFINKEDYNESIGGDGLGSGRDHPCYGKHYNIGEDNPWYGTGLIFTDETRKNMSKAKEGCYGEKNNFYGKHHTEEWKEKYRYGDNNPMAKAVYQYSVLGEYICSYPSISSLPKGFASVDDRCKLSVNRIYRGKRVPYKNYLWSFLPPIDNYIPDIELEPYYKAGNLVFKPKKK